MSRTCYLHLGMNKAGSSSIQKALFGYKDARVEYLDLPQPNHSRHVCLRFLDRAFGGFYTASDPEGQAREKAEASRELDDAIARATGDVVISAEYFCGFPGVRVCTRTLDALGETFDRVQGIMYVRDPAGFMASALQQGIKFHSVLPALGDYYPLYRRRFVPWARTLAPDALDFVPFHISAFHREDLVLDFARRTGINESWAARRTGTSLANESLSAEATAAIVRFRRVDGPSDLRGPRRKATTTLISAMRNFGEAKFSFSPEAIARVVAENSEDISWIEKRMGRGFPVMTPKPGAVLFDDLDAIDSYGATLAEAFAHFQQQEFPAIAVRGATVEEMMGTLRDELTAEFA